MGGTASPPVRISGVPVSRLSDSFENFDLKKNPGMDQAYIRCQAVAMCKEWSAMLGGNYGTGKTHLAIAAMNRYGMARSMFWKVPDFLEWMKRMAFDEKWALDDLLRPYRTKPILLVLDDLGVENQTDWAHEQLYRILDSRSDGRLPTIITTNVSQDRLDGRILSRYAEGLIVCRGNDVRRQKIAEPFEEAP